MKHLYRCLMAALAAVCLSLPAMADVLPSGEAVAATMVTLVLVGVAILAAAIIISVIRNRRK